MHRVIITGGQLDGTSVFKGQGRVVFQKQQ